MPSLAVSQGYLLLMSRRLAAEGSRAGRRPVVIQAQACSVPYGGADPFEGAVHEPELAVDLFGEEDHVAVVEQGVGEPAGADPGLEVPGHGQAGERGVGLQVVGELGRARRA